MSKTADRRSPLEREAADSRAGTAEPTVCSATADVINRKTGGP